MTVYQVITQRIIEKLEQGVVPWRKPWNHTVGLPRNLMSQKPYRGINVWLLVSAGYSSAYWLTYKQAQEIGAQVRKGERGTPIVFFKPGELLEGGEDGDTSATTRRVFLARSYTVFNIEQCELPESLKRFVYPAPAPDASAPIEACERIIVGMPQRPAIRHEGLRPCYWPQFDLILLPAPDSFPKVEHYYCTLFHELGHSTGHASRLNRETFRDRGTFGSPNYSKEELIVELCAAYLCGVAGIVNETVDSSASYIQSWLSKFRQDKTLLVYAAAQAQKAADFILGTTPKEAEDSSNTVREEAAINRTGFTTAA